MGDMSREGVPIVGGAEAGVEEGGERRRPVLEIGPNLHLFRLAKECKSPFNIVQCFMSIFQADLLSSKCKI